MPSQQQPLFDTSPWEMDDAQDVTVASVVFAEGPTQPFDYQVPADLLGKLQPGRRVRVPLGRGNRLVVGYCVAVELRQGVQKRLKPVAALVDTRGLLTPSMLRLTDWIARRYLCPWGQVLETVVPAGVRGGAGLRKTTLLSVPPGVRASLATLELPKRQGEVLRRLSESPAPMQPSELAEAIGCTQSPIQALRKKGLIVAETRLMRHNQPVEEAIEQERRLTLNAEQQRALDAVLSDLEAGRAQTTLLHGVTGSGKTEVYIQAIERVRQFGRQAIVLVPEISLTPQTKRRFCARFGDVAVLHSHLSDSERHWHWQRIASGEVSVVVGARSAIFAPTPGLGLIVMDEEHESSFKQDTAPRYHAREVALQRSLAEGVPLVLGSATPALESYQRATSGQYRLIRLPRRVLGRPMPKVDVIDLRNEAADRNSPGAISRPLRLAMEHTLREGGQVILLLNRRGYNTHIQCPACGLVVQCPHCEISLTHHREGEMAICHFCDYEIAAPTRCPDCQFIGIRYRGLGTQRLESEVRARFPDHPCLRMDTDTMRKPGAHEQALASFRDGHIRILLGTQMIAKGLDFPNVTLVGVVKADTALHFPDFRAAERTFQLLVQVAGRTGRGERGGRVMVQTLSPEHPAIVAAVDHDYETFAAGELPMREMLGYPPFGSMVRFVIRGEVEAQALAFAETLADQLSTSIQSHEAGARVLGPAPCPFAKLRGAYRFQVQAQGPHEDRLHAAVTAVAGALQSPDAVQWIVDVDPLDML